MKIGCGSVLFRKFELERSLEAMRRIGFEYFETQAVGPWCPHVNVDEDDPENLVRLQKKYGFKAITGLWSKDGNIIANKNAVESGIRTVEFAAAAGIPVVHTGDGSKPKDMSEEDAYKVLEEKLGAILEVAKKYNVKMAIEPHGTFSLTLEGLQRILSIGTPDVLGINYDAANIFRSCYVESGNGKSGWSDGGKGENEVEVLKGVIDRVVHCHAKDLNAEKKCVPVGSGLVNVRGCVEVLKSANYEGVVSVETEGGDDFDEICDLAAKSYAYLNAIIKGE
jgi:sugar phosphate isomerase/epimerase